MATRLMRENAALELTATDIIELIRQNGYPYAKGMYINIDYSGGKVLGACAYGQAALNYPAEGWSTYDKQLFASDLHERAMKLHDAFLLVTDLSDYERMSPQDIADWLDLNIRYDEVVRVSLIDRIRKFFGR
jgi:hypothetical protein